VLTALGVCLSGCSAESYRRSADRQVQEIVSAKRSIVTGREEPF